ncbi:LexA family protein [Acetobacterium wieringae]|uniref:LexA family protein n=1 Tax=Acetobacterium wieringae TaxID=52694 RepID=UPI0020348779|nr:XRE family transcriptional regulator [Acetobacterium wieringae]URN84011.1 XRE family transcriptional regulator [Acetobacterium wieringae]
MSDLGNKQVLAENLRHYMDLHGKSRNDLCSALDLSYTTVADWVNGKKYPRIDKIELMANYFGIQKSDLIESKGKHSDISNITPITIPTDTITIKVYGSVPAGQPIEAVEDVIGYEEIPAAWTRFGKEFIALIVKGDSMYPKYFEGDVVIIEVTPDCNNGQDAVVYVNGYDATLKEVHKNDDGSVTLKPFNPEYPPKTYQPGKDGVTILGVVKELRRKM